MAADDRAIVPVWTIGTDAGKASHADALLAGAEGLTAERLQQLRAALTAFADTPIATLEAYPMPSNASLEHGIVLSAASPLANHLADLITRTTQSAPDLVKAVAPSGETLYRMVLPAKVAGEMGAGILRSMPSKAVASGIHSAVMDRVGIVAQASFVPVAAAEAGAATAVGTGAAAAGAAGLLTVAAPLVLLAVAVGLSAHAEQQRRLAIERLTELVEKLHQANLDDERNKLDGCRPAIDKATAVLLDEGLVGLSIGLDSAANIIDTAVAAARNRADTWRKSLERLQSTGAESDDVEKAFPGISHHDGEFRAHLRLAALAITLKRRVAVLQAVEHAQLSNGNRFPRFVESLDRDQAAVDRLESDLIEILDGISRIPLRSPGRLLDTLMTRTQVNDLLDFSRQLRQLAEEESMTPDEPGEIAIEMVRRPDASLIVLPAQRVA